jgi:hypothetical protein
MELSVVQLDIPEGCNIILGQSHFIKTVEDLYEVMVSNVASPKFGLAFCEASSKCLIRADGTDEDLTAAAVQNAEKVASGHSFVIVLRDAFPINFLNGIKNCPEVCRIFCATANPVQVVVAETEQGRGVLGVVDGLAPKGVEGPKDVAWRKEFLQTIGYKR